MKFLTASAAALALFAESAYGFHKGFNIAANRPDGGCKSQADWENNFRVMKGLPGGFKDVRVFASSDCNTLQAAVPAALNQGVQILAGVWTEDENHYNAEKNALVNACRTWGVKWLSAVSVGSEDLYRGDTNPTRLAQQINEVRSLLSSVGGRGIWVGHVDTWTAWVNDANAAVIQAVDFVGFDGYPYWQGAAIQDAKNVFEQSIQATQAAIARHKPGTPLWVTETGFPAAGPKYGNAVPSPQNAQAYWKSVMCSLWPRFASYAFTLRDYNVAPGAPSFGVVDVNFNPIYDLRC